MRNFKGYLNILKAEKLRFGNKFWKPNHFSHANKVTAPQHQFLTVVWHPWMTVDLLNLLQWRCCRLIRSQSLWSEEFSRTFNYSLKCSLIEVILCVNAFCMWVSVSMFMSVFFSHFTRHVGTPPVPFREAKGIIAILYF